MITTSEPDSRDGRRVRGDRARAQILTHSTAIASVEGLDGLTIGRLAAEANVGKGNIQVLFGDKESLQLATLRSAVDLYRVAVIDPALTQPSPLLQLQALVEGWFEFVEKRTLPGGCFINAASNEYRARPGRIRDQVKEHRSEARSRFRGLIVKAKKLGELRPNVDETCLAFELLAYQSAANVAALMGDEEEFLLARQASQQRLAAVRAN
ncbi:transcriptional regulator, TetR family [Sphingomonas guangdongensis]|uniref:Transcriptional regulator, TetR family n=1 Tax=Sphingomonas guangdongensis TaxID=1141890 RepID=A0A285QZ42_9SPHN|nr:TetR/AcrR family transcriptional regulator [Sphingomonas guangdongensis]SOB87126.1 transcriptional regulator, TetR family [Sphingomonas guangdongensis]